MGLNICSWGWKSTTCPHASCSSAVMFVGFSAFTHSFWHCFCAQAALIEIQQPIQWRSTSNKPNNKQNPCALYATCHFKPMDETVFWRSCYGKASSFYCTQRRELSHRNNVLLLLGQNEVMLFHFWNDRRFCPCIRIIRIFVPSCGSVGESFLGVSLTGQSRFHRL